MVATETISRRVGKCSRTVHSNGFPRGWRLLRAHILHDQSKPFRSWPSPREMPSYDAVSAAPRVTQCPASDYQKAVKQRKGPVAVIDIGSNSVRLVVYDGANGTAADLQRKSHLWSWKKPRRRGSDVPGKHRPCRSLPARFLALTDQWVCGECRRSPPPRLGMRQTARPLSIA